MQKRKYDQLKAMTGVEILRATVRLADNCREDFVSHFTVPQLVRIWECGAIKPEENDL